VDQHVNDIEVEKVQAGTLEVSTTDADRPRVTVEPETPIETLYLEFRVPSYL